MVHGASKMSRDEIHTKQDTQPLGNPMLEWTQAEDRANKGDKRGAETEFKTAIADADAMPDSLHKEFQEIIALDKRKLQSQSTSGKSKESQELYKAFLLDNAKFYSRLNYAQFLEAQGRTAEAQPLLSDADKYAHSLQTLGRKDDAQHLLHDAERLNSVPILLPKQAQPESAPQPSKTSLALRELWGETEDWTKRNIGTIAAIGAGVATGIIMSPTGPGAIAAAMAVGAAVGAAVGTGADAAAGNLKGASSRKVAFDFLKHAAEGAGGAGVPGIYQEVGEALGLTTEETATSGLLSRVVLSGVRGAVTYGSASLLNRTGQMLGDYGDGLHKQTSKLNDAAHVVGGALSDAYWGFAGGSGSPLIAGGFGLLRGLSTEAWRERGFKNYQHLSISTATGIFNGYTSALVFRWLPENVSDMGPLMREVMVRSATRSNTQLPAVDAKKEVAEINSMNRAITGQSAEVFQKTSKAVVDIQGSGERGTGFFVTAGGEVETADHVVDGNKTVTIIDANGRQFQAEVERIDKTQHVARLHVDGISPGDEPYLKIAPTGAHIGDQLFAVSIPGLSRRAYEGRYVADRSIEQMTGEKTKCLTDANCQAQTAYLEMPLMIADFPSQPGMSGGPIVNRNGEVVGMIDQSVEQTYSDKRIEHLAAAVPSDHLNQVLATH